jgi:hypothetical protein
MSHRAANDNQEQTEKDVYNTASDKSARARKNDRTLKKDVRAGPGDAGASDRPEQLPDNPQTERRRREAGPLIAGFLVACIVAILVVFFL